MLVFSRGAALIEEGSEFRPREPCGGIGDAFHQLTKIELGGEHLSGSIDELDRFRLFGEQRLDTFSLRDGGGDAEQAMGRAALAATRAAAPRRPRLGAIAVEDPI